MHTTKKSSSKKKKKKKKKIVTKTEEKNKKKRKAAVRISLSIPKKKISMKDQISEKKSLIRDKPLRIIICLPECFRKTGKITTEAKTYKIIIQNPFQIASSTAV